VTRPSCVPQGTLFDPSEPRVPAIAVASDVVRAYEAKVGPFHTIAPDKPKRYYRVVELNDGRLAADFIDDGERSFAVFVSREFIEAMVRTSVWRHVYPVEVPS